MLSFGAEVACQAQCLYFPQREHDMNLLEEMWLFGSSLLKHHSYTAVSFNQMKISELVDSMRYCRLVDQLIYPLVMRSNISFVIVLCM